MFLSTLGLILLGAVIGGTLIAIAWRNAYYKDLKERPSGGVRVEDRIDELFVSILVRLATLESLHKSSKEEMAAVLGELPGRVLGSVVSSTNTHKGKLGELVTYLKVRADYDRIIPLGDIVDLIGIRMPKDGDPGEVAFIEVKSGGGRLSRDQAALRSIVDRGAVKFMKVKVDISSPEQGIEVGIAEGGPTTDKPQEG